MHKRCGAADAGNGETKIIRTGLMQLCVTIRTKRSQARKNAEWASPGGGFVAIRAEDEGMQRHACSDVNQIEGGTL